MGKTTIHNKSGNRRKTSRWKKRRRQQFLAWVAVLSGVLLLAVLVWCVCFRTDRLAGTWHYDEVTAYRFDGRRSGKLILPDKEYPFSYKLTGGKLDIDFANEAVKDVVYDYSVDENQLTLIDSRENDSIIYILTK